MTALDFCDSNYETGHVRQVLVAHGLTERSIKCCLPTWKLWLQWCASHNLQPAEASRADVDQFLERFLKLPRRTQIKYRSHIASIYEKVGDGQTNPGRKLRSKDLFTKSRYQTYWDKWVWWCGLAKVSALPADPDHLAEYLEEVARKKSLSYASSALTAISREHRENDLPDPKRVAPVIQAVEELRQRAVPSSKRGHTGSVLSPTTVERYQATWNHWSSWCDEMGIAPQTAQPQDAETYLTCCQGQPWSIHTIKGAVGVLKRTYQTNGWTPNPFSSEQVRAVMKAFAQSYFSPEDDAGPAVPSDVDSVLPALDWPNNLADSTLQARKSLWKSWLGWCAAQDIDSLDASPEQIASYLVEMADDHKISVVQNFLSTIVHAYDCAAPDRANPGRSFLVKWTLQGLKRTRGEPPAQMTGLTAEDFACIEAMAKRPRPWETEHQALVRGTTDLAIIGAMRDCLLRLSETADLTWDDLTTEPDSSGRLTIRRSKTDQEGKGAVGYVSPQTLVWLREMRELTMAGPTMFGISSASIYRRIVEAALYAGLEGRYGGHSQRIGMAQDLSRDNVPLHRIMQAGRWKDPAMPAYYIRKQAAGFNAVAQFYERNPGLALIE